MKNAVLGSSGSDLGNLLENIVYLELKRRGYDVYIGKYGSLEIDFIARKNKAVEYYQVTLSMIDEATRERELRPLAVLKDNYKKYIISLDDSAIGSFAGIVHLNALDFLLQNGS